jgi:hypothetical protein
MNCFAYLSQGHVVHGGSLAGAQHEGFVRQTPEQRLGAAPHGALPLHERTAVATSTVVTTAL